MFLPTREKPDNYFMPHKNQQNEANINALKAYGNLDLYWVIFMVPVGVNSILHFKNNLLYAGFSEHSVLS